MAITDGSYQWLAVISNFAQRGGIQLFRLQYKTLGKTCPFYKIFKFLVRQSQVQILSETPALRVIFCGFPTRRVGSEIALVPSRGQINPANEHRISQSWSLLSCFAEPQEAAEFLTYKRARR